MKFKFKKPGVKKIKFFFIQKEFKWNEKTNSPAYQALPEWFKKMPINMGKDYRNNTKFSSTIKKCVPVMDAFTMGYMLYVPCDIEFKRFGEDPEPKFYYTAKFEKQEKTLIEKREQTPGFPAPAGYDSLVWRMGTGQKVITPPGHSILMTHPINQYDLPFMVISAVVDTDEFSSGASVNFFLKKGFEGIIKKGTPLVQIIPFQRDSWQSEVIEPNREEYYKKEWQIYSRIERAYRDLFWHKKDYR